MTTSNYVELKNVAAQTITVPSAFTDVLIEDCSNVRVIYIEHEIERLSIKNAPKLEKLTVAAAIKELALEKCALKTLQINAHTLRIRDTFLNSLAVSNCHTVDLQNNVHLQTLELQNGIRNLSVVNCPSLWNETFDLDSELVCLPNSISNLVLINTALKKLQLPRNSASVKLLGLIDSVYGMFCNELIDLDLPESILSLVLCGAKKLETLQIPSSARFVQLSSMESLRELHLPYNLVHLSLGDTPKLELASYPAKLRTLISSHAPMPSALPSELNFLSCDAPLSDTLLPRQLHSLFLNGNFKEELRLPDELKVLHILGDIDSIRLSGLSHLRNLVLPSSARKVELWEMPSLRSLSLPEKLESLIIGHCGINAITLPRSLKNASLAGNLSLRSIEMQEGIMTLDISRTSVGRVNCPSSLLRLSAMRCEELREIRAPNGLILIDIEGCQRLDTLVLPGTLQELKASRIAVRTVYVKPSSLHFLKDPGYFSSVDELVVADCHAFNFQATDIPETLRRLILLGEDPKPNLELVLSCFPLNLESIDLRSSFYRTVRIDNARFVSILELPPLIENLHLRNCPQLSELRLPHENINAVAEQCRKLSGLGTNSVSRKPPKVSSADNDFDPWSDARYSR